MRHRNRLDHVVHPENSAHYIGKLLRDNRIGCVRECGTVAKARDSHIKRMLRTRDVALEPKMVRGARRDSETFAPEPSLERPHFRNARTEAAKKRFRLQPFVIARRCGILLVREQLVELGPVVKREPDLHIEGGIRCSIAQRRESFSLDGMVSVESDAIVGVPERRAVYDYRKAECSNADGEGDNPAISKRTTARCLPQ